MPNISFTKTEMRRLYIYMTNTLDLGDYNGSETYHGEHDPKIEQEAQELDAIRRKVDKAFNKMQAAK